MKIAVFFPGIGYRFNKPLLYYSKKLAKECGYDTFLEVDYWIKKTTNIRGNAEKMREAFDEACESAEKFLAPILWQEYDETGILQEQNPLFLRHLDKSHQ